MNVYSFLFTFETKLKYPLLDLLKLRAFLERINGFLFCQLTSKEYS